MATLAGLGQTCSQLHSQLTDDNKMPDDQHQFGQGPNQFQAIPANSINPSAPVGLPGNNALPVNQTFTDQHANLDYLQKQIDGELTRLQTNLAKLQSLNDRLEKMI